MSWKLPARRQRVTPSCVDPAARLWPSSRLCFPASESRPGSIGEISSIRVWAVRGWLGSEDDSPVSTFPCTARTSGSIADHCLRQSSSEPASSPRSFACCAAANLAASISSASTSRASSFPTATRTVSEEAAALGKGFGAATGAGASVATTGDGARFSTGGAAGPEMDAVTSSSTRCATSSAPEEGATGFRFHAAKVSSNDWQRAFNVVRNRPPGPLLFAPCAARKDSLDQLAARSSRLRTA